MTINNELNVQGRKKKTTTKHLELCFWKQLSRRSFKWNSANHQTTFTWVTQSLPDRTSLYLPCKDSRQNNSTTPNNFFSHKYISNFQHNLPHNPLLFQLVHGQEHSLRSINWTHEQANSRRPRELRQRFQFSLGYTVKDCYTSLTKLWWSCAFQIFANN